MKVATWDLETTHLKSNFGVVLCAGIKPLDKKAIMITQGRRGSNDKQLLIKTAEELEKHDILVSYYGKRFDLKMLNSRLLKWGEDPLEVRMHIDMYDIVKRIFNTHSRRLQAVSEFLNIKGKGWVEPNLWMKAALDGDKHAMKQIIRHCEEDVEVLEALYKHEGVKKFIKTISRY